MFFWNSGLYYTTKPGLLAKSMGGGCALRHSLMFELQARQVGNTFLFGH